MGDFKLTTVEEFEAATNRLLETGQKVGADGWQYRVKNQTPHCKFGETGICCRICAMGPCRITPKAPRGICGCDAHGIVARNYLKFTAGGSATHSDHGREICHTLYCADPNGAYKVKDPEKLIRIAKEWGVETEGKDIYDLAHEMAVLGMEEHIETVEGDWAYIESGAVRGFVQQQNLTEGTFAEKTAETIGEKNLKTGIAFCERAENAAYTYTHTTAQPVLASKQYAIMLQGGSVYEYESETSKVVGTTTSGTTVYALVDNENGWVYIESGDVRGFVEKNRLLSGSAARTLALDQNTTQTATACVEPEDNRSLYYTLRSTQEAVSVNQIGTAVASYAASFAGKLPYIWGGTSLSAGADCSGFTQSVYRKFGISIPRLAEEQGISGESVASLALANPGDIVCYGSHVGIYLGNGKVAQCSGDRSNTAAHPGRGVTICAADYRPIASIRRYLINTESGNGERNYRIDPTNYTTSELELIYAIVAQEDNGSYEGALAVISSAMNRTESAQWGRLGGNALSQLTAPGQYCYSMDHYWKKRLNGNVPDYVVRAVSDCLKRGIRNHKYTSFRSRKGSQTGASAIQIGGNWFFGF